MSTEIDTKNKKESNSTLKKCLLAGSAILSILGISGYMSSQRQEKQYEQATNKPKFDQNIPNNNSSND